MADFTILGFVVDRYPAACSLLTRAGYDLIDLDGGADSTVSSRQEIGAIHNLDHQPPDPLRIFRCRRHPLPEPMTIRLSVGRPPGDIHIASQHL